MTGHPLDADEFSVPLKLPEVSMFWTTTQVAQILGTSQAWIKANSTVIGGPGGRDPRLLRLVDLTPHEKKSTLRVRHTELQRFLAARNIPYA